MQKSEKTEVTGNTVERRDGPSISAVHFEKTLCSAESPVQSVFFVDKVHFHQQQSLHNDTHYLIVGKKPLSNNENLAKLEVPIHQARFGELVFVSENRPYVI